VSIQGDKILLEVMPREMDHVALYVGNNRPVAENMESEENRLPSLKRKLVKAFFIGVVVSLLLGVIVQYTMICLLLILTFALNYKAVYLLAHRAMFVFSLKEGDAAIIIAGPDEEKGSYIRTAMNYSGHHIGGVNEEVLDGAPRKTMLSEIFPGIFWLTAIPGTKSILKYKMARSVFKDGKVVSFDDKVTRVVVNTFQYAMVMAGFETGAMVPVGFTLAVKINIARPKTVIENTQWLTIVTNAVWDVIRQFISDLDDPEKVSRYMQETPRDVEGNPLDTLGAVFMNQLQVKNKKSKNGGYRPVLEIIRQELGVIISDIDVKDLDLGAWAETAEAFIKTEREGKAKVREAELKGDAFKEYMDRQSQAFKSFYEKMGDDATALQYIEMLRESSKNPAKTLLMLPSSLNNFLEALGGKI